jgi:hypothetical protein
MPDAADPEFLQKLRLELFQHAADTGRVPQAAELSARLALPEKQVRDGLVALARAKVLIMAPNDDSIWAANPFCAVPSGIRVQSSGKQFWAICVWDALGVGAALGADALITAPCGDCGEELQFQVRNGKLVRGDGIVHFAVPAHHWWDNIGFT